MINPKKQLLFIAAMGAIWIGTTIYERINDRKRAAEREQRMAANRADHEAFMERVASINNTLEKQLEDAEFWAIIFAQEDL